MIPATVVTEDLFLSNFYTVDKFAPFRRTYSVLLNCGEKFYQCKSEHKLGTTFVHLVFTAAYLITVTQDTDAEHLITENPT
jgi:hypothetical protein